ncbi:hypothetical protein GEMRC1_003900 [Eukaryota sp. GEM-RC1]
MHPLACQALNLVDLNDYHAGSILAVQLRNFTVCNGKHNKPITIIFGSSSTWVLGSNGSGKSSVLDAIGLCLGLTPTQIGRNSSEMDYVSNNSPHPAEITVFLSNGKGSYIRVHRQLNPNKPRTFICSFDGKKLTKRSHLYSVLDNLKIDLSSLIQFTPQFKMEELTKKSPKELFHETLQLLPPLVLPSPLSPASRQRRHTSKRRLTRPRRDIEVISSEDEVERTNVVDVEADSGSISAVEFYDQLVNLEGSLTSSKTSLDSKMGDVTNLKDEIAPLEAAVERFHNKEIWKRKQQLLRIRCMQLTREKTQRDITQGEALVIELGQRLETVKKEYEKKSKSSDTQRKKAKLVESRNECSVQLKQVGDKKIRMEREMSEVNRRKQHLQQKRDELKGKIRQIDNEKSAKIAKKRELEEQLHSLEPLEDLIPVRDQLTEAIDKYESDRKQSKEEIDILERSLNRKQGQLNGIKEKIRECDGKDAQQLDRIRRQNSPLSKALQLRDIIDRNQSSFKGKVFGPMFVEASFSKQKLFSRVSPLIQGGD